MIKAVIFDHDGVIFNNEPVTSQAYDNMLRSMGKTPVPFENGLIQPIGIRGDDVWKVLREKYDIREDTEFLRTKKREFHAKLLEGELTEVTGLTPLLQLLKEHGIKMAVATGSAHHIIEKIMTKLQVREFFEIVIGGSDVKKGKPDPECFILAAQRLGIDPKECAVIEDAEAGVLAGKAAGMKVIALRNDYNGGDDFSKADIVVSSLKDITWEKLDSL